MEFDFESAKYEFYKSRILSGRKSGKTWEEIRLLNPDGGDIQQQLNMLAWISECPRIEVREWYELVRYMEMDSKAVKFEPPKDEVVILDRRRRENNEVGQAPRSKGTSWVLYKKYLKEEQHFSDEAINTIENNTIKILRKLDKGKDDSNGTSITKGLVIGNVQSGKTSNMAALMAMAADYRWNMFVILSGRIESLRVQTRGRLYDAVAGRDGCNHNWNQLDQLKKNFGPDSNKFTNVVRDNKARNFVVCLKNPTRLNDLYEWFSDRRTEQKIDLMIIDDEADEAGVNTHRIEDEQRSRINGLICDLANGTGKKLHSINYIGYTATPYANVLNESSKDSLYPRDFICALPVSNEYFGPQQIFGYSTSDQECKGLNIVRHIEADDIEKIRSIHKGILSDLPDTLIESVIWFLCSVSCIRSMKIHCKPVSMLIHTSQNTTPHENVYQCLENWFKNTSVSDIEVLSENMWEKEKRKFNADVFRREYPDYSGTGRVEELPDFDDIKGELHSLLNSDRSFIKMEDDRTPKYHKGIHFCIDNCINNGITDEGEHIRLVYPSKENKLDFASAFIIIGGNTLSRGLTIEGLTSTFFLRSSKCGDSLMQMGRWFGYRRGYELLPRIWITENTEKIFKFLSRQDKEFREEIEYMAAMDWAPAEYGPKVLNRPETIAITSKNKMQSASQCGFADCSGRNQQTYKFDNDFSILNGNIGITEEFLLSLGPSYTQTLGSSKRRAATVWKDVKYRKIRDFLSKFRFHKRLGLFGAVSQLLDWFDGTVAKHSFERWNVAVAGLSEDRNGTWKLPTGEIVNKVSRTKIPSDDSSVIDIRVLTNPEDLQIDYELLENKTLEKKKSSLRFADRDRVYGDVPLLLLYRVDKNSKTADDSADRCDLNAPADLIGVFIHIPGKKEPLLTKVSVDLDVGYEYDIDDGDCDDAC